MIYDAIIVGGGPAGISAAVYLKRAGKNIVVLEKFAPGGQLNMIGRVENYPGFTNIEGTELAVKLYQQAEALGIKFIFAEAKEYELEEQVKKIICAKEILEAYNIILALGSFTKPLDIPGEQKLRGRGVSYCATCDGNFFKGKEVAVVGGGDSAIVDALYLSSLASKVYLLCDSLEPVKVKTTVLHIKKNIVVQQNVIPLKIEGTDQVEAIVVKNNEGERSIKVDAVFVAIGRAPDTSALKGKLEMTVDGFIKTDNLMRTNVSGVYAVGDVRDGQLKQIVTAASDGAIAATDIVGKAAN